MARKPKALVLDSWSVLAYLEDEPAGPQVADLIADAHESDTPLMMTVVNAGEVWYITARETSEDVADRTILELAQLGIQFFDADWKLAREASKFKVKGKMSFAVLLSLGLGVAMLSGIVVWQLKKKKYF